MLLNHNIYIHVFQNHEMKLILKYNVHTQSAHVHVTQFRISFHGTSVEHCYRTGNQELKASKIIFNKKNPPQLFQMVCFQHTIFEPVLSSDFLVANC